MDLSLQRGNASGSRWTCPRDGCSPTSAVTRGAAFLVAQHTCIRIVMKLIVAILIALSMIGSPGAARAAPSVSCTMAGADEGMTPDHEKVGCCTPDCATPAPAAVLPGADVDEDAVDPFALLNARPEPGSLPSIILSTDDPPPRAFFA